MLVVFGINPKDTEADGQGAKQIVIGKFLRSTHGGVEQKILTAGRKATAGAVVVFGDIDLEFELFQFTRQSFADATEHQIGFGKDGGSFRRSRVKIERSFARHLPGRGGRGRCCRPTAGHPP